jgi:hypothetical protein
MKTEDVLKATVLCTFSEEGRNRSRGKRTDQIRAQDSRKVSRALPSISPS